MSPGTISKLIAGISSDYDIAVGSRYIKDGNDARNSRARVMASRLINKLAQWLLRSFVCDLTSGFIASGKHVFRSITLDGYYGEYCIDFILRAQRAGFKIKEIPYTCVSRSKGKTKTAPNPAVFIARSLNYFKKIFSLINT
jgi:dolichol-phosphate mannosyltransferase